MRYLLLWACVGVVLGSAEAVAAPTCGTRAYILTQLGERYTEAPIATGVANTGGLVEVIASQDGSTWTILLSNPDGQSCLVGAGTDWVPHEWAAPQLPGDAL